MTPIINIDSTQILEAFEKVLNCIHKVGFTAIASIVDGHSANTKFYKTLSQNFTCKEICLIENSEDCRGDGAIN